MALGKIKKRGYILFLLLVGAWLFAQLFPLPATASYPGLNGRVLFSSDRGGATELYTMRLDGSDLRKIIDTTYTTPFVPRWFPDGTKLVFQSNVSGNNELYSAKADGSGVVQLTSGGSNNTEASPSPDGTKIAFISDRDEANNEVYTMNADGSGVARLTNNVLVDADPSWSPDGSQLVFMQRSTGSQTDREIWKMNADGTNQTQLTPSDGTGTSGPVWSPDGSQIVFINGNATAREVGTMDADGSNTQILTSNLFGESRPRWFPDSSKIIFTSDRDGNIELYTMNRDGSNQTNLTNNAATDNAPDVQPLTIPPTLQTDSKVVTSFGPVVINVLDNDSDAYGSVDPATVSVTAAPTKGQTSVNTTTGEITYTPTQSAAHHSSFLAWLFPPVFAQTPDDSFTYQACSSENAALCSSATVNITFGGELAGTGVNSQPLIVLGLGMTVAGLATLLYGRQHRRQRNI